MGDKKESSVMATGEGAASTVPSPVSSFGNSVFSILQQLREAPDGPIAHPCHLLPRDVKELIVDPHRVHPGRLGPTARLHGVVVILDDCPPRHKRHQPEVIRALTIREGGSAGAQLQQLVEEYGYALPTAQTLAQRQNMPEEEMVRALEDLVNSGDLLEILPRRYLAAPLYRKACQSVEQVLAEYHKANPLHAGMKVAALRQKALRGAELKEADAILTAMLRGGTVTAIADRCALPDFRVVLTKRQTALRQKLLDSYRKSGREVPFVDDIYASFPTNERDDCKKVLENLVSCGELVMLTPQLFYHKDVYEEVCALTRDFFEGHPAFTLAEYRDLLGTSRKYALAILEFFDKTKVTKMVGDHREVIGSL